MAKTLSAPRRVLHFSAAVCAWPLQVLSSAKSDERVRGLFTVLGDRSNFGGMAQLQELRNALLDFRVGLCKLDWQLGLPHRT
jgi:hypothetical protein